MFFFFFFFKQKTAYEIRKGDWSSDVCSSDLRACAARPGGGRPRARGAAIDLDRAAGSGKRGAREHRARVHRRARVPEPDDLVTRGEVDVFTEHGEDARGASGAAQRESRLPAEHGQQDPAQTLPRAANLYAMRLRYPAVLIA